MTDQPVDGFIKPDKTYFLNLARMKMPYGKYAGRRLVDLPEHYVVWMSQKGFPKGELGRMLQDVYEIKVNGLEYLFRSFR
ncbi:DUF3820 family protein [bacterium]|nr:DUF3820 family protein [bacterium]